ncbi:hypothetical protein KEM48_001457 [Puccinia striiformis f. sp. tritici PST-130]|nr:hypothetical protein KEM48_001457 [Puccinia striiformis f. sp. tritici PST-130]
MLGYENDFSSYRIYKPSLKKAFRIRNVKFDEAVFPGLKDYDPEPEDDLFDLPEEIEDGQEASPGIPAEQRTSQTPTPDSSPPEDNSSNLELAGCQEQNQRAPKDINSAISTDNIFEVNSDGGRRRPPTAKGKGKYQSPASKPSMNDTDPFDDILFDFDDLSNPSNKEFLLNNINNDFAREAPFLIEDRLKDLFSTFLSDLSGTIETIPGTLLETSIRNFGEIMREAMKAMITTDVIPSMLDSVLSRIRGGPCENELPDLHVELRQFESLMSERVSTIQDSIYEVDNNTTASLESLTKRIMDTEAESSHCSRYTNEKLSDMADQEDARNERVNRKLNDLASTINNLNYKFSQLIDPTPLVGQDTPPHIADRTHSDHLSSVVSAAPRVIQPTVQNRPTLPAPAENDEFPPLNHGPIDLDVKKELWRGQQHQSLRPTWRDNNQFKRTADPKPEPEAKKPPAAAPTPPYTKASITCNSCGRRGTIHENAQRKRIASMQSMLSQMMTRKSPTKTHMRKMSLTTTPRMTEKQTLILKVSLVLLRMATVHIMTLTCLS